LLSLLDLILSKDLLVSKTPVPISLATGNAGMKIVTGRRGALGTFEREARRSAVEAGMGATAISASVAAPSIEAGLLYQVPLQIPDRLFHVLHHAERQHSKVAERLLQMIAGQ
jgi:DNA-binding transcriptional LysR family regulator